MLDKLEAIKARFDDLAVSLSNPAVIADNRRFSAMSKEYRGLEKIVQAYQDYKKLLDDVEFYKEALNGDDAELREAAEGGDGEGEVGRAGGGGGHQGGDHRE